MKNNIIENLNIFLQTIDTLENLPKNIMYAHTDQLYNYKKRHRSRRTARNRIYDRCKNKFMHEWVEKFKNYPIVPGAEHYDFLIYSLLRYGWDERWPLIMKKKNTKWKIANGHHRISICKDLNISPIPLIFKI